MPHMSTEIYRREAAADLCIQASSVHPESLKIGMIKGEVIRYISMCSREKEFDKASTQQPILRLGSEPSRVTTKKTLQSHWGLSQ